MAMLDVDVEGSCQFSADSQPKSSFLHIAVRHTNHSATVTCRSGLWLVLIVARYSPDHDIRLVPEGGRQISGDTGGDVERRAAD